MGAAAANEDIKATTGLFDPSRGAATPNADSGFAIDLLQQQGATATYHFFDNFMRSMWFGYRILVDLIPRIYDTPRVIRIVRPDDVAEMVQIGRMFTGKDGKRLRYDLAQGTYAVVLSVQPSYATRKMRAAAELTQLAKADPQQLPQWADLFVRQLDIGPLGDEIADRLTPPQYAKNQPNPQQVQQQAAQLAQQNQMLQQQVTELSNVLATKSYETQAKNEQNARDNETKLAIAAMQEETKRMSQATTMAVAEIETKVQTIGRTMADVLATLREREAMAHQIGMVAHGSALTIHDASQLPPGTPGGPPAQRTRTCHRIRPRARRRRNRFRRRVNSPAHNAHRARVNARRRQRQPHGRRNHPGRRGKWRRPPRCSLGHRQYEKFVAEGGHEHNEKLANRRRPSRIPAAGVLPENPEEQTEEKKHRNSFQQRVTPAAEKIGSATRESTRPRAQAATGQARCNSAEWKRETQQAATPATAAPATPKNRA